MKRLPDDEHQINQETLLSDVSAILAILRQYDDEDTQPMMAISDDDLRHLDAQDFEDKTIPPFYKDRDQFSDETELARDIMEEKLLPTIWIFLREVPGYYPENIHGLLPLLITRPTELADGSASHLGIKLNQTIALEVKTFAENRNLSDEEMTNLLEQIIIAVSAYLLEHFSLILESTKDFLRR